LVGSLANYCALLTAGGVDCWGLGSVGSLGDGSPSDSDIPVAVEGVGGIGTLTGVSGITSDGQDDYCALLSSSGVDCWGANQFGELGNGTFSRSLTPVAVVAVGGTGTLTGVTNITIDGGPTYCALLTSSGADCWGYGFLGNLGNGTFYSSPDGSAVPVAVEGVGGTGTLSGVSNLVGGYLNNCAVLTSGGVDCWGSSQDGELGDGTFSKSATPVAVEGVGGIGTLGS
jgi:alpha-tubulin suppressor-like RCC1 family protein